MAEPHVDFRAATRERVRSSRRDSASGLRVLILGGDTDHNLGDQAILRSLCEEIRRLRPDAALSVVSADTDRARTIAAAEIIAPGPRGFLRLCRAAARSHLVLCGGGGLFQDDDSLVKMPYWACRVALARALCGRVVGCSLGVGPLEAPSSRLFARMAFACMDRVTVRDPGAQETAQALTRKPVELVPDPALLLRPVSPEAARGWLRAEGVPLDGQPLVGVAVRRWFPARRRIVPHRVASRFRRRTPAEDAGSQRLTSLLAAVLDRIVARHGARVLFLPTYTVPHEADDRLCEDVLRKMSSTGAKLLRIEDPALYKGVTGQLAALLGGRMHPTILAAAAGTPVVGLAYNPKFRGFFALLGIEDQVLDVGAFLRFEQVEVLAGMVTAALRSGAVPFERVAILQGEVRRFVRSLVEAA